MRLHYFPDFNRHVTNLACYKGFLRKVAVPLALIQSLVETFLFYINVNSFSTVSASSKFVAIVSTFFLLEFLVKITALSDTLGK